MSRWISEAPNLTPILSAVMAYPVKVLPTYYNGIEFRSRAEARWAVVFDELGWRYDYEPEGYSLKSGWYLPDFFLPDRRAYFEVKGSEPTYHECRKAEDLAEATERIVIISTGPPRLQRKEWDRDMLIYYPERCLDDEVVAFDYRGGFVSRRRDDHPACSIDLGNLAYLGSNNEMGWETAFSRALNTRFGVHE